MEFIGLYAVDDPLRFECGALLLPLSPTLLLSAFAIVIIEWHEWFFFVQFSVFVENLNIVHIGIYLGFSTPVDTH